MRSGLHRWRRRLAASMAVITCVGVGTASASVVLREPEAFEQVLARELGLVRSAIEVSRGLEALERHRSSAQYTTTVLEHAAREGLRQWLAHRSVAGERDVIARQRARALYRLAHGGAARLVFEGDAEARIDRIERGRALRRIVRYELRELALHRRAGQRATAELVSAARELQAAGAVAQVGPMQAQALRVASRALAPAVESARSESLRQTRAVGPTVRRAHAQLVGELERSRDALRRARAGGPRLVRPVPGAVVGAFGAYIDPTLRLPMNRDGVELRAAPDSSVRAMAGGQVVLVSSMPGFGDVVSVDHGDGRFSLSARLWHVTVQEGQHVEAGDIIGRVAPKSEDDGLGSTVYVELRHGERPVDPTSAFE